MQMPPQMAPKYLTDRLVLKLNRQRARNCTIIPKMKPMKTEARMLNTMAEALEVLM